MPDKSKFLQIKSMLDSLSKAVADYESDYEGGSSTYEKDPYDDKDEADGGQDVKVLTGFSQTAASDEQGSSQSNGNSKGKSKKEKMSMMTSLLKKKASGY